MARKTQDLENQIREIRKQLGEQVSYLDFRTENKLSLLAELKDFYKKRGEVEFEYAKNLERLCDRFERNTKQRNIKYEVRSTFNLWSTLLAETRRIARDKSSLAEVLSLEIGARLDIMSKDVLFLARKCKEVCTEVQENLMKELKELNEQSKHYQYACHHSSEAHSKYVKSHEKVESLKNSAPIRRKKAEEKEQERLKQYNEQKHRLLKTRNDYLLRLTSGNARLLHFYSVDVMDIIEFMDHDYHESYKRLVQAYSDAEQGSCNQVTKATDNLVNQSKTLDFENDLHYFMSEFSGVFTQPPEFHSQSFGEDEVTDYKVNVKDVFLRAQELVKNLTVEVKTLRIQTDEDSKTIGHMTTKNLKRYQVQTIDDALGVLEEAGEPIPPEPASSKASSLDRGSLATTNRGVQALHCSQKGKEDTFSFTLGVFSRKLARAAQLNVSDAKLEILEKSLSEQKVPPISVGGDFRFPKLFGGDCLEYIMATGLNIPLVLSSCCDAILKEGVTTEGLFRVPGPAQQIEDLKKGFEEGRDPLAFSVMRNIEITAVASVLKLYFRELSSPLFPCEKYYDFIKCTRKEDQQDRLDSIREAVNYLHPAVCNVMRYLFRFLYNVSEHHGETKMNTANLALVFGPTLTRAPPDADTRLLHNDVPSINVLIQLCIEHYEYLFGEDSEEEEEGRLASPPPPPPLETSLLGTSLDDEGANFGYRMPLVNEEREDVGGVEDQEVCVLPEVPIINEEPPTPTEEVPPARPPPPIIDTPEPLEEQPHPLEEPHPVEEPRPLDVEEPRPIEEPTPPVEEPHVDPVETEEQVPEQQVDITEPVVAKQPEATPTTETQEQDITTSVGLSTQTSTTSVNTFLDQALQEIETSIEEMKDSRTATIPTAISVKEEEDDDTDDESDTEEEVMTIAAKALYDYTARTEKELTFSKGDELEVIDKTKDGNWWDGFHGGRRGYVPVKYVEIAELHTTPVPPQRKSSMNKEQSVEEENDSSQPPVTLATVQENVPQNEDPPTVTTQEVKPEMVATTTTEEAPPTTKSSDSSPKHSPEGSPKRKKPVVPVKTGAVSKLTQQFQQPPPTQAPPTQPPPTQRVLVGPHKTHNRYPSADMNKGVGQEGTTPPRSNSSGSKPSKPPPAAPKPKPETPPTSSPFPLMSHDARVSASPLQRAHLQGTKTAQPAPVKKGGVFRGSAKKTGATGGGDKPPLPSKPQPPAKATGSVQLQAELSSVVTARRRKPEDDTS